MKTSGNTILITGAGSGIGFETAKLFHELGNTVILTGRNEVKLKAASAALNGARYIVADITNAEDVDALVTTIKHDFPNLNVLMNNAGIAFLHTLGDTINVQVFAQLEMQTNYFAAINLTSKLLPVLKEQAEAAVINVSSVVAFAPALFLPTYSASKAALHAYTQALRLSIATDTNVKVFELMPPLVDTELSKDIPSDSKISPREVAEEMLRSFGQNKYEVRVASAEKLYRNFLTHADKAVLALNGLELN